MRYGPNQGVLRETKSIATKRGYAQRRLLSTAVHRDETRGEEVGNELRRLQGREREKRKSPSSLRFISNLRHLSQTLSDSCAFADLRDSPGATLWSRIPACVGPEGGSQVATEVTIWSTSPFSPWMAPWMASFTSMSACSAGVSSAACNTSETAEGRRW